MRTTTSTIGSLNVPCRVVAHRKRSLQGSVEPANHFNNNNIIAWHIIGLCDLVRGEWERASGVTPWCVWTALSFRLYGSACVRLFYIPLTSYPPIPNLQLDRQLDQGGPLLPTPRAKCTFTAREGRGHAQSVVRSQTPVPNTV